MWRVYTCKHSTVNCYSSVFIFQECYNTSNIVLKNYKTALYHLHWIYFTEVTLFWLLKLGNTRLILIKTIHSSLNSHMFIGTPCTILKNMLLISYFLPQSWRKMDDKEEKWTVRTLSHFYLKSHFPENKKFYDFRYQILIVSEPSLSNTCVNLCPFT